MERNNYPNAMLCDKLNEHYETNEFGWSNEESKPGYMYAISYSHLGNYKAIFSYDKAQLLLNFSGIDHDDFETLCKNGVDHSLAFLLSLE
jgi:hypothetical protein